MAILLFDTFDLAKILHIKSSEVKSLDNAKWYIQEFCKTFAGQPLWVLLYFPGLSSELRKALEALINLFDQDSPSVDKIKEIYRYVKNNHVELNLLLTQKENYEKGFMAFVDSIEGIKIDKAWWNEMLEKINQLPKETAYRKQSDVEKVIYKFYINKVTPTPPQPGPNPPTPPTPPTPSTVEDDVKEAKDKIKTTNMPNTMWQMAILNLIDEYPETAEFFKRL